MTAHTYDDPLEFKEISQRAVVQSTPNFSAEWEKEGLFSLPPIGVIDKLRGVRFIMLSLG